MAGKAPENIGELIEQAVTDLGNYDDESLTFPPEWMTSEQTEEVMGWNAAMLERAAKIAIGVVADATDKSLMVTVNITKIDTFQTLLQLIKEVAEKTTEPHIRERIITRLRRIQEEADYGH